MRSISMKSSKEIILAKQRMYQRATKQGKSSLFSSLQETTGLSRKHISRVLKGSDQYEHCPSNRSARGRKAKYNKEHAKVLKMVWQLLDYPCATRLKGSLKDTLDNLLGHGHLTLSMPLCQDLQSISSATINRVNLL